MPTTTENNSFRYKLSQGQQAERYYAAWISEQFGEPAVLTSDVHEGSYPWDIEFRDYRIDVKFEAGYRGDGTGNLFFEIAQTHSHSRYETIPEQRSGKLSVGAALAMCARGELKPVGLHKFFASEATTWVHLLPDVSGEFWHEFRIKRVHAERLIAHIESHRDRKMAVVANNGWHGYGITLPVAVLTGYGVYQGRVYPSD